MVRSFPASQSLSYTVFKTIFVYQLFRFLYRSAFLADQNKNIIFTSQKFDSPQNIGEAKLSFYVCYRQLPGYSRKLKVK